jgi:hypothetical protein
MAEISTRLAATKKGGPRKTSKGMLAARRRVAKGGHRRSGATM